MPNQDASDELDAISHIWDTEIVSLDKKSFIGELSISVDLPNGINLVTKDGSNYKARFLQPIQFRFSLNDNYPSIEPPNLIISSEWLTSTSYKRATDKLIKIWEDQRDVILSEWIDWIKHSLVEELSESGGLPINANNLKQIEATDQRLREEAKENETFSCPICMCSGLPAREGASLAPCEHMFCKGCLSSFFNCLVKDGGIQHIKCPSSSCKAVDFLAHQANEVMLLGLIDEDLGPRYKHLKTQRVIEDDPKLCWCPSCRGPAEKDQDVAKLAYCSKCEVAFCWLCGASWHGMGQGCKTSSFRDVAKRWMAGDEEERRYLEFKYGSFWVSRAVSTLEEELKSDEWIQGNTTKCPTCDTAIEKTEGCNHMICEQCGTHFCYRCSSSLDPDNIWIHFSEQSASSCRARLFDYNPQVEFGQEEDIYRALPDNEHDELRPQVQQQILEQFQR